MICLLIRHGKTPGNERGAYIGCKLDESLSKKGVEEAKNCILYKDLIKSRKYRIFTSPLKRAVETAELLFEERGTVVDELTEIDFGEFEGKNYEELNGREDYQQWIDSGGVIAFPGGESMEEYGTRCKEGFRNVIKQTMEDEMAIIVAHGGTIMALLSELTGENYFDFQVKNLEGYLLEFRTDDETVSDLSYNRITFRRDS